MHYFHLTNRSVRSKRSCVSKIMYRLRHLRRYSFNKAMHIHEFCIVKKTLTQETVTPLTIKIINYHFMTPSYIFLYMLICFVQYVCQ
jgi:hypothetical protein